MKYGVVIVEGNFFHLPGEVYDDIVKRCHEHAVFHNGQPKTDEAGEQLANDDPPEPEVELPDAD